MSNNGRSPSALATPTPTDISTGNVAATNISATNVTTNVLVASNLNVGGTAPVGTVNVKDFGAKGDGVTDDTTSIQNALNSVRSSGGTVVFPPGTYKTSSVLTIFGKNIIVIGNGATILFSPILPLVAGINDRAISVGGGVSNPYNFAGAVGVAPNILNLGATSFTAANAADAATLQPNDWLILSEKDTGQSPVEIYYYDQYQVASVSGTTVNLQQKVRTAFPGTHSIIQFTRLSALTQNITIRDLTLTSTFSSTTLPVVAGLMLALGSRTIVVENIMVNMPSGNAMATYQTADLKISNCAFNSGNLQSVEIASTVDCMVENCTFDFYNQLPSRPSITIDFGTAFSCFANNTIRRSGNFGMGLFYGVHDCVISGNTFGWVTDLGIGGGLGINGIGSYNNAVVGNVLIGGDNNSTGINFGNDAGAIPPVTTRGNRIAANRIGSFAYPTGIQLNQYAGDTYLEMTTDPSYGPRINAGRILALSDTVNNNPFINLTSTGQNWSINGGTVFQVNSNAGLAIYVNPSLPGIQFFNWAMFRVVLRGFRSTVVTDWTPNPIPAQGIATLAISVPGALVGDMVALGTTAVPAGVSWSGWANTNDTVTVQLTNPTAAPISPVAATWYAAVFRLS